MTEYDFDRVTVSEPEPVRVDGKRGWLYIILTAAHFLISLLASGAILGLGCHALYLGHITYGCVETTLGLICALVTYFGFPKSAARYFLYAAMVGLAVVGIALRPSLVIVHSTAETYPPDGPSAIFGQTTAPEIDCCEVPQCREYGFLARFVDTLDREAESPVEVRDVLARSYAESRFTPTAVSDTGDYGICQINAAANPDVDVDRLTTDPNTRRWSVSACTGSWLSVAATSGSAVTVGALRDVGGNRDE